MHLLHRIVEKGGCGGAQICALALTGMRAVLRWRVEPALLLGGACMRLAVPFAYCVQGTGLCDTVVLVCVRPRVCAMCVAHPYPLCMHRVGTN